MRVCNSLLDKLDEADGVVEGVVDSVPLGDEE